MGDRVSNRDTLYGIEHGMAYVPEDRNHVGSSANLSVTDNVIMKNYRKPPDLERQHAGYERGNEVCRGT